MPSLSKTTIVRWWLNLKIKNMKSTYIAIIRQQEQIIKRLQATNYLYFLAGFSLGIFSTLLILTILK